jgi:hypothetical protein
MTNSHLINTHVIGDPADNHFHAAMVLIERTDARIDQRLDCRALEHPSPGARRPSPERGSVSDNDDIDYASVFHPHGEALGPGELKIGTVREKNAAAAGHTRSFAVKSGE